MRLKLSPTFQILFLLFVTLGVYYPTLFAPFNSLDDQAMVDNLLNQQGFSWSRHFAPGGTYDYYRPLLTLTYEIDKHVGGLQETFMHLINVLVHVFNVILVWAVARRFGVFIRRPSEILPLIAALLFGLHPINTEAVNWIVARTDLLAGTFVFVSLYALLEFFDRRSLFWGGGAAVALLAGALCKETALFLIPGACFLMFFGRESDCLRRVRRWTMPALYGAATAAYFALRWGAFHSDRGLSNTTMLGAQAIGISDGSGKGMAPGGAVDSFPWGDAVLTILKTSGFYATKLLQPLPLNFAIRRLDAFYIIPGVLLVLALTMFAWNRRRENWMFLISASIAVSALFVVFTGLAWTPIAERYMYIPSAPFVIGVVYMAGSRLSGAVWHRSAMLFVPLLIGGSTLATVSRNIVWQDNLTLYQDAVRQSPGFAPARNQLALAYYEHGREEDARKLLEENNISHRDSAAVNRAAAYWESGDYEAARADLLRLLDSPGAQDLQILEMLIKLTAEQAEEVDDASLKTGYYKDILGWLEQIHALYTNGFTCYRIGRVHLILGQRAEAKRAFAEAASRLHQDSLYYGPAVKLARDLAE